MPPTFFGLSLAEIVARLEGAASVAAGVQIVARVGAEAFGCRNVGIDLPAARRSASATRALRQRLRDALEGDGVILAESALAARVRGDVCGSVWVREAAGASHADASHLLAAPSAEVARATT